MRVRRDRSADRHGISAVHRAAFGRDVEATLVDQLRDCSAWIPELSFVALRGEELAGHVVCTRATVEGVPVLGLGPLGVLPRFQGVGVGSVLVHTVIGAADALGEPLIVLLGDPKYYSRFGFVLAATLGVVPVNVKWAKHFQGLPLAGYTPGIRGEFQYAAPFMAVPDS
jgi:putative acetyltransferase